MKNDKAISFLSQRIIKFFLKKKRQGFFFWLLTFFIFSDLWLCFCSGISFFTACTPAVIYIHTAEMKVSSATRRRKFPMRQVNQFFIGRIFCCLALKHKAIVSTNPFYIVERNLVFYFHLWLSCVSTAGEVSI